MNCREMARSILGTGRSHLLGPEAYRVCDAFAIPYPESMVVSSIEEGVAAATSIGFPVVVKIVSPQVVHKSDVGGVAVGIQSAEQLRAACSSMLADVKSRAPEAEIQGLLVQKAVPRGVEVAVGGLRDPQFGPVVMFGLGGVLIEVLRDISFRLAPLSRDEALTQMAETRAFKMLQGVRGSKPCNVEAVADLVVRAGNLLAEIPEVGELDFNPVIAYEDRAVVVDARIILSDAASLAVAI